MTDLRETWLEENTKINMLLSIVRLPQSYLLRSDVAEKTIGINCKLRLQTVTENRDCKLKTED